MSQINFAAKLLGCTTLIFASAVFTGCASTPPEPKLLVSTGDTVRYTIGRDFYTNGNTACFVQVGKNPICTSHPSMSHMMLTINDGDYRLVHNGTQMPYYHSNISEKEKFEIRRGVRTVGSCLVTFYSAGKLRTYKEQCDYGGNAVQVVTVLDNNGKNFVKMTGSVSSATGVRYFIVE